MHRIPGTHIGRLAGARRHRRWSDYLHDRLRRYAAVAPALGHVARHLHQRIELADMNVRPLLLHHDLQPGHLLDEPAGGRFLIDWELAVYGDRRSDLGRLAVRLGLDDPTPVLAIAEESDPAAEGRLHLYWHIHLLADAALSTDPAVRERAASRLPKTA
ncbi:phosphotransferase family protein [Streptomyces sp. NPDC048595]|uniref:phosphotransferase family protein n=1 Tax=Streptomyces sp. NPDC048595 TaxID=3365576 RepID=UPI0037119CD7